MVYFWLLSCALCYGQEDCGNLEQNSERAEACKKANEAYRYYEFDPRYDEVLSQAIAIDSSYGQSYKLKALPYLKRGDLITWKLLIDEAVRYEPERYLIERANHRFYHLKDYAGALRDIDTVLDNPAYKTESHEYTTYYVRIMRALCFRGIGKDSVALSIMEELLYNEVHWPKPYDFIHFGKLYLNIGNLEDALNVFTIHSENYQMAETEYYLALIYYELDQKDFFNHHIEQAHNLYLKGLKMTGKYTTPLDKIYEEDIIALKNRN